MQHKVLEGNAFGGFERALDLVHGVDAARLFRVQHIDGGRAGTAHFAVGKERSVHGERGQSVGTEPFRQLSHVLAAGVVEVLARGKNLHRLRAGAVGELKQSGMKALVQEQVRGQNAQHGQAAPRAGCFVAFA